MSLQPNSIPSCRAHTAFVLEAPNLLERLVTLSGLPARATSIAHIGGRDRGKGGGIGGRGKGDRGCLLQRLMLTSDLLAAMDGYSDHRVVMLELFTVPTPPLTFSPLSLPHPSSLIA